jgi:SPP1 gp7 family putative phage head morphogenesis protein
MMRISNLATAESKTVSIARRFAARVKVSALLTDHAAIQEAVEKLRVDLLPEMVDVMLFAYLFGMDERYRLFGIDRSATWLSLHTSAIEFLSRRMGLGVDKLDALQSKLEVSGLRVLNDATNYLEKRLQKVVMDSVSRGWTKRRAVEALKETYSSFSDGAVEAVFRTQTQLAHSAGRWNAEQDSAIQDILWGYEYVTARDDRVRENHAALHGTKQPKDHPLWDSIYPPNGWNCRCTVIPILRERRKGERFHSKLPKTGGAPDKGWAYNPGKILFV